MHTVIVNAEPITPSKILCVGRNYVAHIEELGNTIPSQMVVFNKPNSAIGSQLKATVDGENLHYEGEIAFAIAGGKLAGVGFGLDLTRRKLQSVLKSDGLPWERAKAFDGAALFSAFVPVPEDVAALRLQLCVDGQLRQSGGVSQMIHGPDAILKELESYTTLEDGDIIMTGTPAGVGEIASQEHFVGEVFCGDQQLIGAQWTAL